MKKRRRLVRFLLVIFFLIGGAFLWLKLVINKQPSEHPDPGIPDVEVPDPDEPEE